MKIRQTRSEPFDYSGLNDDADLPIQSSLNINSSKEQNVDNGEDLSTLTLTPSEDISVMPTKQKRSCFSSFFPCCPFADNNHSTPQPIEYKPGQRK